MWSQSQEWWDCDMMRFSDTDLSEFSENVYYWNGLTPSGFFWCRFMTNASRQWCKRWIKWDLGVPTTDALKTIQYVSNLASHMKWHKSNFFFGWKESGWKDPTQTLWVGVWFEVFRLPRKPWKWGHICLLCHLVWNCSSTLTLKLEW